MTRPGNARVAVAYLRVSTDRQDLGPDAQRAAIEAWAAREGVTVAAWHFDNGVSGGAAIDKRPALLDALAAIETHGAGVLVIAKRDRLSRDTMNAILLEGLASKAGAKIVSAAGEGTDGDANDPAAFLMRRIVDLFAEYERLVIKARTRAALRVKKARGESTGETPYGFRAEGGVLVADEREQATMALVAELRAAGLSVRAIARELAARGHVARSGRPLGSSQVHVLIGRVAA
jgi:site-specific DNA recombinase